MEIKYYNNIREIIIKNLKVDLYVNALYNTHNLNDRKNTIYELTLALKVLGPIIKIIEGLLSKDDIKKYL